MAWWQTIDFTLFHWINSTLSNAFFDALLPWCRERWFWAPLYLFMASFVWLNFDRKRALIFLIGLGLAVSLTDFTSSTLIKKRVQRLRPCNDPRWEEVIHVRVSCGSGYSFTSSHAANHFAAAVYISLVLAYLSPWIRPLLFSWAFLIAFSQVYVGVHYPADVLAGGLLGGGIGWWTWLTLYRRNWLRFPG